MGAVAENVDSMEGQVVRLEKEHAQSCPDKMKSSRCIIVQFISRTHRHKIWRDAKFSAVLRQKSMRILYLTPVDETTTST